MIYVVRNVFIDNFGASCTYIWNILIELHHNNKQNILIKTFQNSATVNHTHVKSFRFFGKIIIGHDTNQSFNPKNAFVKKSIHNIKHAKETATSIDVDIHVPFVVQFTIFFFLPNLFEIIDHCWIPLNCCKVCLMLFNVKVSNFFVVVVACFFCISCKVVVIVVVEAGNFLLFLHSRSHSGFVMYSVVAILVIFLLGLFYTFYTRTNKINK